MHGSIRERLEALLGDKRSAAELEDVSVGNHLAHCSDCASDLAAMKAQSDMLRLLRPAETLEPTAGFYARVMQRIEERTKESLWASLIYSPLSSRIAYASLTMALLLGSYVITAEKRDGHLEGAFQVIESSHYDAPVTGNVVQQRNAVLENFASH